MNRIIFKVTMQYLYKYLPSQYLSTVLNQGKILFRNLTFFRQYEGNTIGDKFEGIHKFNPDSQSVIYNLSKNAINWDKRMFFHSTNSDLIFVFCLSLTLERELMDEFNCDTCIEIFNPNELIRRIKFKLARTLSIHRKGLIAGSVRYYNPKELPDFDYTNPSEIIFAKDIHYYKQNEFRLAFGKRQAFKLIQQFTKPNYDPFYEAMQGKCADKIITIGNLTDIARLVKNFRRK